MLKKPGTTLIRAAPRRRKEAVNVVAPTPIPARPAPARLRGSVAGLLAAGAALGVGELVTGLFRGAISPVIAVGECFLSLINSKNFLFF